MAALLLAAGVLFLAVVVSALLEPRPDYICANMPWRERSSGDWPHTSSGSLPMSKRGRGILSASAGKGRLRASPGAGMS